MMGSLVSILFGALLVLSALVPSYDSVAQLHADETVSARNEVRLVADSVLRDASFLFVDKENGKRYSTTGAAPADAELKPESRYNDWRYWNGVLNIAMLKLGSEFSDTAYTNFAAHAVSFDFDNYQYFKSRYKGEDKWSYPLGQMIVMKELDDYGAMGASLIEAYRLHPEARYLAYIDSAAAYITHEQGRLADGTLARTFPRKWTIWADDLYMSVPFLARLGVMTHDESYFDDAARQVINFNKYLFNPDKGLMHHCWYSDTKTNGVAFWGRANGWMLMAQVELLDRIPPDFPLRDTLLALFRREIRGLVRYQDTSGLWHQLLDRPDSYLETSCSAMFTYSIARAVEKGYIDSSYASVARLGWKGILSKIRADGKIEGVCTGTGVGDNLKFYYDRPAPLNDVHGIGAVLLAGTEMMVLEK